MAEAQHVKTVVGVAVDNLRSDERSIHGYIEANYGRAKKYRTKDSKLYGGSFRGNIV